MFTQAFKNNKINTTVGLLFTIQFIILIKNIGLFTEFKIHPYLIASSLTIEIIGLFLLSPFYKDFIFFRTQHKAYKNIMNLHYFKDKDIKEATYNLELESFQKNYNKLRVQAKNHILSSEGNILSHDFEINRILQDIDLFFDSTIRILFNKNMMEIPYLPVEEFEEMVNSGRQKTYCNNLNESPELHDPNHWKTHEIKEINFYSLSNFIRIYGNIIRRNPRNKSINIIAIAELFKTWNGIVIKLEPKIYSYSKKEIIAFYNEKQKTKNYFYYKYYELFTASILGLITASILEVIKFLLDST
ncbi:hypothetical protein RE476_00935 [Methanolobus mangrovi]|uniref:Uncharacterized protein n=1 Tax=Methanolobus mangrovi TaxID=3072977 RepID=A0AA51YJB2_9EURY|nr:hypothetical protein [Methanolobus mangrovi]WMW22413.1 hypothetical protein RE476_00935 [Methanolobus mangrovi]